MKQTLQTNEKACKMKTNKLILCTELQKIVSKKMEQYFEMQKIITKFPIFKEDILKNLPNREYNKIQLLNKYKNIYLHQIYYRYKKLSTIINYKGKIPEEAVNEFRINTYTLYNSNEKYNLEELVSDAFFYDNLNTTFYVQDKQLIYFLDRLDEWYTNACKKSNKDKKEIEKQNLMAKLKCLKNNG